MARKETSIVYVVTLAIDTYYTIQGHKKMSSPIESPHTTFVLRKDLSTKTVFECDTCGALVLDFNQTDDVGDEEYSGLDKHISFHNPIQKDQF